MATKKKRDTHEPDFPWKCHGCDYIGKYSSFIKNEGDTECPRCSGPDTFPHRMYKCKGCGKVGDQDFWFDDAVLDDDPLIESREANPCDDCLRKWEKEHKPRSGASSEVWTTYYQAGNEQEKKPTELEEVPVEPSPAK